ncbi:hypothetical protein BaRGS_00036543, partial [Batillaria attramentaria]
TDVEKRGTRLKTEPQHPSSLHVLCLAVISAVGHKLHKGVANQIRGENFTTGGCIISTLPCPDLTQTQPQGETLRKDAVDGVTAKDRISFPGYRVHTEVKINGQLGQTAAYTGKDGCVVTSR